MQRQVFCLFTFSKLDKSSTVLFMIIEIVISLFYVGFAERIHWIRNIVECYRYYVPLSFGIKLFNATFTLYSGISLILLTVLDLLPKYTFFYSFLPCSKNNCHCARSLLLRAWNFSIDVLFFVILLSKKSLCNFGRWGMVTDKGKIERESKIYRQCLHVYGCLTVVR